MPHIHALVPYGETAVCDALREHKTAVRQVLADMTGYDVGEIALVPNVLTELEQGMADNMLPLEFVIDTGKRPALGLDDEFSDRFNTRLIERCSVFNGIHFGTWIKLHRVNGFAEHKPTTSVHAATRRLERMIPGALARTREPSRGPRT